MVFFSIFVWFFILISLRISEENFELDDDHVGQMFAYAGMSDCIEETADCMAQNWCKLCFQKMDFLLV